MTARTREPGKFTGRHMLGVMIAFFGVIIAVNMTLATFARSSFAGLVVQNSYVASQEFNEHAALARAQAALGWKGDLAIDNNGIHYRLSDNAGNPVEVAAVTATFRRPTYAGEDRTFELARTEGGAFAAGEQVGDGNWIVEIDADVAKAEPYRDVRRIAISRGVLK